jgi:cytochrome c-type biogenesis protein CcmE
MNKGQKRRLYLLICMAIGLASAISLMLYALKQNINVFLAPSQLAHVPVAADYHFRLGGIVRPGSVVHDKNGLGVEFIVTDFKQMVRVRYVGVLPDLFREGKGVIASGSLVRPGFFSANEVLAKHDENYMPPRMHTT